VARPQGPDAEAAFPVINPPLLLIFRYGMLGLFPGEPAAAVYPRSLHIHYLPINCLSSLSSEAAPARYKKAEQPARVPSKDLAVLALAMASCPRCVYHHSPRNGQPTADAQHHAYGRGGRQQPDLSQPRSDCP
jgi:hypothetical protein